MLKHDEGGEETGLSISEEIEATVEEEMDIIVTVLATVDSFGLIWVFASLLVVVLFTACYCCCCQSRKERRSMTYFRKS